MGTEFSDLELAEMELAYSLEESTVGLSSEDYDVIELGKLDRNPNKSNWVEDNGGLPKYIEDIADSLHRKRGMTISRAIATAISQVKRWARGGENVKADTRAKAAKAVAQWEALKAKARVKKAAK